MGRYAWGIDVGDGTLKAVRLRAERRGLRVVRTVEIPYHDPFLETKTAPSPLDRRAAAALDQLIEHERFKDTDRVLVGFPSFHVMEGVVMIPRVEDEKREDMIRFEVNDLDKVLPQPLIRRNRPLGFVSSDLERVAFLSAPKTEYEAFLERLQVTGIPYDGIYSSCAALAGMAVLSPRQTASGQQTGGSQRDGNAVLILSIGYSAAEIVHLSPGRPERTRAAPRASRDPRRSPRRGSGSCGISLRDTESRDQDFSLSGGYP